MTGKPLLSSPSWHNVDDQNALMTLESQMKRKKRPLGWPQIKLGSGEASAFTSAAGKSGLSSNSDTASKFKVDSFCF